MPARPHGIPGREEAGLVRDHGRLHAIAGAELAQHPLDVTRPDESSIAVAIGSGFERTPPVDRPDESAIAAAIGSGDEPLPSADRPDERKVAAAISSH